MEQTWDQISDLILYAAFAVLAVFVVLGIYQLITRKSLKKIDQPLLAAPIPLVLMAATYVIFDKFLVLNTRPNGTGEPSFPSTHVMVVATIFAIAALLIPRYIKNKPARIILYALMLILLIAVAAARVLAHMHWASDVAAGLIFAAIFAAIYYFIVKKLTKGAPNA